MLKKANMYNHFDDSKVRGYIKKRQEEGILPKGKITIYNVETLAGEYKIFKCKIKQLLKQPRYYIIKEDNLRLRIKEIHSDKWDDFKF